MKSTLALLVVACTLVAAMPANPFPSSVEQFFGYITVNASEDGQLFYWGFPSTGDPTTDPVILWMTGGPGCSSSLALFMENGPYRLSPDNTVEINPYAWNQAGTVIYLDQPYGTGFSTVADSSDYVTDETEIGDIVYGFLLEFFTKYPQYNQGQEFYVFGESYGGHYVPAVSARIVKGMQEGDMPRVNFHGCGIGDGLVDPKLQYPQYGLYALANNLIQTATLSSMNQTVDQCEQLLSSGDYYSAFSVCNSLLGLTQQLGLNPYNIDLKCDQQTMPLCYNMTGVQNFLNNPTVQKFLGVDVQWQMCNPKVYTPLIADWGHTYAMDLTAVLAAGKRVITYYGELDFICNWFGGRAWANALPYAGHTGFQAAEWTSWVAGGNTAGQFKTFQNFTFVSVYNAGHMVPMDQPQAALAILEAFIANEGLPTSA